MSFRISRTAAPVGAIVTGLDLDGLSRGEAAELYRAFLEYGVLVFKGMQVDDAGQIALSNLFGEAVIHPLEHLRVPGQPLLVDFKSKSEAFAKDDPEGDVLIGQQTWHCDGMYTETPPRGGLLRAIVLPKEGGDTGWIDSLQVYRELPYRIKCKLQGLRVVQSYARTGHTAQVLPEIDHPILYAHPELDRPALAVSPSSAVRIVGLPEQEAAELLDYLIAFMTREERAYRHHWEPGDMVLWDNWRCLHRAYGHPKRYPRVVRRTSLKSELRLGRAIEADASVGQAA
jgi:taurine dioxygenase